MDVLLISTSSGRGRLYAFRWNTETCAGLTKENVHGYANPFPNPPIRVLEDSRHPAIKGAWLDVTYTYPISYDSPVVKIHLLLEKKADFLEDVFEYFRTEELCRCSFRHLNLESLEQDRALYEKMKEMALQDEQNRNMREESKRVSTALFFL
jgi:hypothetical protein